MKATLIFAPMLVQVLLTIGMYIALQRAKWRAVRSGEVDEARRALHDDAWPDYVRQINNNIRNQFEVPILFFVLCFMLWALESTGLAVQTLAWIFVSSRLAHAWVHARSNRVPLRRRFFVVGVAAVAAMALIAASQLLTGTSWPAKRNRHPAADATEFAAP
jgi:hypothetical protein